MTTKTQSRPETGTDLDHAPLWDVMVWNDPVNLMTYVEYVFATYFHLPIARARELMLQVHNEGRAIVARGVRESLEMHVAAMHGFGLWATLERDE